MIFFCKIVNDLLHKGTVEVHWNFKEYHQIIKHSMIIIFMWYSKEYHKNSESLLYN